MRKILVGLLSLFRRASRIARRLRGKTEEDIAAERVASGQSWDEFCDTLKAAAAALNFPGAPRDAFSQAEGYRYLSRLTRAGLMAFVEYADPRAPVLHRVADEITKLGADNPDNYYRTAAISGAFDYRISGRRNSVATPSFGTQAGHYGQGGGMPATGHIEAGEIEMDENGCFELVLSSRPHDGNWLPMTSETGTLVVRQTFLDRQTETPAELRIERINCADEEKRPSPLTPHRIDEGLKAAGSLVAGASLLFAKWARDFQRHSNSLPMFDPDVSNAAGGDPNIVYYHSHWALADDEALLIEVTPPPCEYWNFQLNNYWMESLDYRYHNIHTNKHLAQYEADGSVRLVVAHADPGLPNWIDTAGHASGTMCFRWVRSESHPQPKTRVIELGELDSPRGQRAGMAKRALNTSTNYENPYRPLAVAILNAAGRLCGLPGGLDAQGMVANAKRRTGLRDFGDEWFVEPLAVLGDSINAEAELTPLGRWIQKSRLEGALAKRLRVEELLRRRPEIRDIDLGRIIVIAALQRTGTTTLHRLIGADPSARELLAREALDPLPAPGGVRIRRARMAERAIAYMAPEFFAVHPIEHDAPEEDILLLDLCFMSQSPEAVMHVPSYANWLESQDHTKAYEYLRTLLKILHWQRPGRFWVLKTPHHAEYLDVILKVFPEATIMQTHRDPQMIVGSFCSMVAHGRGMLSDRVDTREIASHWTRKMRRMMKRSMEARKRADAGRFVDLSYGDLLRDPVGELERIYREAGIVFGEAAERAAQDALRTKVQHRYGRHVYRLDDFGLTRESVEQCFSFYRREYRVPHEQA